jgi:predicted alpha/beta-fold hydrolase
LIARRSFLTRARDTALGHFATVEGFARGQLRPEAPPVDEPFVTSIPDPVLGSVPLTGRLAHGERRSLVIIVHGMGGSVDSAYVVRAANAATRAGHAALRIHLRGGDGSGADVYHAGLGGDLAALVASPELARFETIGIVGYSLGGHVTLRHAADGPWDPRLRAFAALSPPIDLDRGTIAIQRVDRRPYQEFILKSMRQQLVQVSRHRPLAIEPHEVERRIRTIRDWDREVICPRFGYDSVEGFYRSETVGPRLPNIRIPTLLVVADRDPMIALDTVVPWLEKASDAVTVVRKLRGGHVAFPRDAGLTTERGAGMENEVIRWMTARLR